LSAALSTPKMTGLGEPHSAVAQAPGRARALLVAVAALLAIVAGWSFNRVFAPGAVVVPVVVGALVPSALVTAGLLARGGRPLPTWVTLIGSALLWLTLGPALATNAASPLAGGGGGTGGIVGPGLRDGWKTLLTTTVPAPAQAPLLFLVLTLVWWAAYWAAEAAVRPTAAAPGVAALPRTHRWHRSRRAADGSSCCWPAGSCCSARCSSGSGGPSPTPVSAAGHARPCCGPAASRCSRSWWG
jgi:hypothetical protein